MEVLGPVFAMVVGACAGICAGLLTATVLLWFAETGTSSRENIKEGE